MIDFENCGEKFKNPPNLEFFQFYRNCNLSFQFARRYTCDPSTKGVPMKFALVTIGLVTSLANAAITKPLNLKRCAEHLPDIRACIEVVPITKEHPCSNESQIRSGTRWADEFQIDAIYGTFTETPEFCNLLTNTVEFGPNGEVETYCCGG